jgi:hypothetical protein
LYLPTFEETEEKFEQIFSNKEISENEDKNNNSITMTTYNYFLIMIFAFVNSFLSQGIRYILPKTLTHVYHIRNYDVAEQNLNKVISDYNASVVSFELQISSISSVVVSLLNGVLIEQSFFKRLKLLRIVNLLSGFTSYSAFYFRRHIDVFACVLKTTLTMQDQIFEIYATEIFETKRRVLLLSIYNVTLSINNFLSPYVNDLLTYHWFRINYLVSAIMLTILMFLSIFLTKEKN